MVKYGLSILASYLALLWGYRVLLHPLRIYPGPLLAKVTDAYAGYFTLAQILPYKTWQNHVRYGPMLRHGPNRMIFNSASALQDIYQNDKARKSFVYELTVKATGTVNIFNAIDDKVHRRKRRLVGHAINERAMRSFEASMIQEIEILLQQILKSNQEPVNTTTLLRHLTMDVVTRLSFGYHLNTQTDDKDRWLSSALVAGNSFLNSFINFPLLHYANLDWLMTAIASLGRIKYEALIHRMVQTRLSQPKDLHPDLFASLTNQDNVQGDEKIDYAEIWQEASFFISAGADTTSAAMSALLFYLSRHQEIYERLVEEIRSTFQSSAEIIGGSELASCQYLRACIDEALRMSPPYLGTQVGVSIFALHHNADYFPEPFSFKPDRWQVASEAQRQQMNAAFAPFSIGPRGCAGKAMAYLEISLVTAKLLWHFDIKRAPNPLGEVGVRNNMVQANFVLEDFAMFDVFSASHDGPFLVFQPRNETIAELK